MYTATGNMPDAINAEFVEDGDKIYFYYTVNYYLELDENSDEYRQYKALADDVPTRSMRFRRDLERQCRSV